MLLYFQHTRGSEQAIHIWWPGVPVSFAMRCITTIWTWLPIYVLGMASSKWKSARGIQRSICPNTVRAEANALLVNIVGKHLISCATSNGIWLPTPKLARTSVAFVLVDSNEGITCWIISEENTRALYRCC